jgi:penicillin-binding protein 1B
MAAGVLLVLLGGVTTYFWINYARIIDAKLGGEQRPAPRIFGRPFDLRPGLALSPAQLTQRLNDVGYADRPKPDQPGEFTLTGGGVLLIPRGTPTGPKPRPVRVEFSRPPGPVVTRLSVVGGSQISHVALEAPLLAALAPGEKQRKVALSSIPRHMVDAVIAIEDKRFYDHPGVDPIRAVGAIFTNLFGNKPYLVGASTLTQQIVKNTFLTPEKTMKRKLQEQLMALVLESRLTKDQILELYLNTVTLGQRGPFEIHGVAEAARIFFGKDLSNVTLAEAATIAGVIQAPSRLSPFNNPDRAKERRDVVLKEMAARYVTKAEADKATAEPLKVYARALENEAPYFVDYVSQLVDDQFKGVLTANATVDVYTTLDLQLQRFAQEAVGEGIAQVDKALARKKPNVAETALIAVDPRSGEILAFVGGRAYFQSQYNRVVAARRQPGSVFKPFVYLAAFERMAVEGRADLTPATIEIDEPTIFKDGESDYAPSNYQNEYDGPITLRRALALSRNVVAIKVAEAVGYDHVAEVWQRVGVGAPVRPIPSIALGVFEATPLDMATAYMVFTNGGSVRPLTALTSVVENGKTKKLPPPGEVRQIASPQSTFLVTNMMRSVLDEGTGHAARDAGFTLDAAGKTGTTNDLRDAWFIGFTPELLTAVWVGFDNNQPIGLTGAQAALPIWTGFMKRALAGHGDRGFDVPDGIVFADICKDSGKLANPTCPRTYHESFLAGTEPHQHCDLHKGEAR